MREIVQRWSCKKKGMGLWKLITFFDGKACKRATMWTQHAKWKICERPGDDIIIPNPSLFVNLRTIIMRNDSWWHRLFIHANGYLKSEERQQVWLLVRFSHEAPNGLWNDTFAWRVMVICEGGVEGMWTQITKKNIYNLNHLFFFIRAMWKGRL